MRVKTNYKLDKIDKIAKLTKSSINYIDKNDNTKVIINHVSNAEIKKFKKIACINKTR